MGVVSLSSAPSTPMALQGLSQTPVVQSPTTTLDSIPSGGQAVWLPASVGVAAIDAGRTEHSTQAKNTSGRLAVSLQSSEVITSTSARTGG